MIYTIDRLNQMIFNTYNNNNNNTQHDKIHYYDTKLNNDKIYVKGRIDWVFIIF
jgi:hypothetical protein